MQWKLALAFAAILFVLVNLYLFQVFDEGLQEKAGPNFGFHRSDWRSLSPVVDQGHCVDDLQHCTANLCVANASTALRTCRATCGLCRPARFFDVKDRTLLSNLRLMPQVSYLCSRWYRVSRLLVHLTCSYNLLLCLFLRWALERRASAMAQEQQCCQRSGSAIGCWTLHR